MVVSYELRVLLYLSGIIYITIVIFTDGTITRRDITYDKIHLLILRCSCSQGWTRSIHTVCTEDTIPLTSQPIIPAPGCHSSTHLNIQKAATSLTMKPFWYSTPTLIYNSSWWA